MFNTKSTSQSKCTEIWCRQLYSTLIGGAIGNQLAQVEVNLVLLQSSDCSEAVRKKPKQIKIMLKKICRINKVMQTETIEQGVIN